MGEELALLQAAVGGQVELAVHGLELAVLQDRQGVVVLAGARLLDEADHRLHLAGLPGEVGQPRVVGGTGQLDHLVAEAVAGQRELREHQQLQPRPAGLGDHLAVALEVGIDIAQGGVDLGGADPQVVLIVHGRVSLS